MNIFLISEIVFDSSGDWKKDKFKMEDASTKPKIKRRSQFRIKSRFLMELYKKSEIVELKKEEE